MLDVNRLANMSQNGLAIPKNYPSAEETPEGMLNANTEVDLVTMVLLLSQVKTLIIFLLDIQLAGERAGLHTKLRIYYWLYLYIQYSL